jgi:hypothetical protein
LLEGVQTLFRGAPGFWIFPPAIERKIKKPI